MLISIKSHLLLIIRLLVHNIDKRIDAKQVDNVKLVTYNQERYIPTRKGLV